MSKIDGRDKMDGSLNIYNRISGIVSARVNAMEKHARGAVRNALVTLLGDNIRKYDFDLGVPGLTDDDLQGRACRYKRKDHRQKKHRSVLYLRRRVRLYSP